VARDEETFQPKPYVNKLPESLAGRQCIVLDPMLATGGSLAHTIQLLLDRGATGTIICVCVLAAPEGIETLRQANLDLAVYRRPGRAAQRHRLHRPRPRRRR
jgi:uracil phosphoribosyltransferase